QQPRRSAALQGNIKVVHNQRLRRNRRVAEQPYQTGENRGNADNGLPRQASRPHPHRKVDQQERRASHSHLDVTSNAPPPELLYQDGGNDGPNFEIN
ncbi:unnamed protein product, partial [Amoebophrya sp. A25]